MYPILQKIGYTKAGKCGLWGHCDLIWFFFQHLKTTRIKLSNDWAVIRRQPFIETLLGDTQSAYIHFFSLCSSSPPLPAPPCSLPQSSSWRRWFGFVRLDGGVFFSFFLHRRLSLPLLWPGECLRCVPNAAQYARCLSLSPSLLPEKHLYSASSLMSAAQASTCFVRNELLLIKNQQKWACNTLCPINILTSSSSN